MKYTNIRAFEKHLVDAAPHHFSDIYVVLVKDPFQCKQMTDRIVVALSSKQEHGTMPPQSFDAATTSIETLIEEFSSFTFFSKKRILIVHHLDKAPKPFLEKLEVHLSKLKSMHLILSGSGLSAATKLYKALEKHGVLYEQAEEKPWEKEKSAQEWVIARAQTQAKQLSPQTALFLIKHIGTDLTLLFQEMEKLFCYVGLRKEISIQDIQAICGNAKLDSIWQLGEAIFRREASAAFRISKGLLEEGIAFLAMLRQLRSQFETECQICCLLIQGGGAMQVSQQFPYMKGAILERHLQQAQSYGFNKLKAGILKIDETELQAKNSGLSPEILNELLIAYLTK